MADSIDLNFNLTGQGENKNNELISSLNNLGNKLSSFESILSKFVTNTKSYTTASNILDKHVDARLASARASQQRAIFNSTDRGASIRERSLSNSSLNAQTRFMREQAISDLRAGSSVAFARGDTKEGTRLQKLWESAISRGTRDGLNKSALGKIGGFGSLLYAAKLGANQLSSYYNANAQIGIAAMTNPFTNNYDYGSPMSRIMQLSAQQHYSMASLGLTGAGAGIGALLGGPMGLGVGATIGGTIGQIFGAAGNSKASLQADAISNYINQRMTNEALLNSNASASQLLTSTHGIFRNKFSIGKGDDKTELDPTMPLAREIAKGVAVYNRNYKEMDTLTNLAIAAQVPMSQLAKLGGAAGLLNLNGSQISKMANLASNSGISITDLMEKTLMFQQGGFSKDSAMNAAARSFQQVSGFQTMQQSFYGSSSLNRAQQAILARSWGIDVEALYDPSNPNHAQAMMRAANLSKYNPKNPMGNLIGNAKAAALGISQSFFNPNNINDAFNNSGSSVAKINPNSYQMKIAALTEATSINAKNRGTIDVNEITKAVGNFAQDLSGTTMNLDNFNSALKQVIDTLKNANPGNSSDSSTINGNNISAVNSYKAWGYVVHHRPGSTTSKLNSAGIM